jgi:hypothetical protein
MGPCTRETMGTMGGILVLGDVAGATAGTSDRGRCVGAWTRGTMVGVLVLRPVAKIGRWTPLTMLALVGLAKITAHASNAKRTNILMWLWLLFWFGLLWSWLVLTRAAVGFVKFGCRLFPLSFYNVVTSFKLRSIRFVPARPAMPMHRASAQQRGNNISS